MDCVFNVNRESKLLCEPFQGRPLLARPLNSRPQAKSQLCSTSPVKGVITINELLALLPRFGKEVRFLADLLHRPYRFGKKLHPCLLSPVRRAPQHSPHASVEHLTRLLCPSCPA